MELIVFFGASGMALFSIAVSTFQYDSNSLDMIASLFPSRFIALLLAIAAATIHTRTHWPQSVSSRSSFSSLQASSKSLRMLANTCFVTFISADKLLATSSFILAFLFPHVLCVGINAEYMGEGPVDKGKRISPNLDGQVSSRFGGHQKAPQLLDNVGPSVKTKEFNLHTSGGFPQLGSKAELTQDAKKSTDSADYSDEEEAVVIKRTAKPESPKRSAASDPAKSDGNNPFELPSKQAVPEKKKPFWARKGKEKAEKEKKKTKLFGKKEKASPEAETGVEPLSEKEEKEKKKPFWKKKESKEGSTDDTQAEAESKPKKKPFWKKKKDPYEDVPAEKKPKKALCGKQQPESDQEEEVYVPP
eukprot:Platyproteum_vivax@DN5754_c0_g1_i3.p1